MRLAAFEGDWSLERKIEDMRLGQSGALVGTARFEPCAEGLAYAEEGLLRFGPGLAHRAARRYLWRAAGPAVEVMFADGRFFHRFDAEEVAPEAAHDCAPDLYHVRYDFTRWPHWRAQWRVRGPRKDYAMVSVYRPAPARRA